MIKLSLKHVEYSIQLDLADLLQKCFKQDIILKDRNLNSPALIVGEQVHMVDKFLNFDLILYSMYSHESGCPVVNSITVSNISDSKNYFKITDKKLYRNNGVLLSAGWQDAKFPHVLLHQLVIEMYAL